MAQRNWNEDLITKVEKGAVKKYARDARKYAVDAWHIHIGEEERPKGWRDPYASLDKPAAKKRTAAKKK